MWLNAFFLHSNILYFVDQVPVVETCMGDKFREIENIDNVFHWRGIYPVKGTFRIIFPDGNGQKLYCNFVPFPLIMSILKGTFSCSSFDNLLLICFTGIHLDVTFDICWIGKLMLLLVITILLIYIISQFITVNLCTCTYMYFNGICCFL